MAQSLKLWELGEELESVIAEIVERDGEIDEETEIAFNAVQLAFAEKVERVVFAIRNNEARARMVNDEIDRLKDLARPYERTVKSLKRYLYETMSRADVKKIDRPLAKAWIQKNGRPQVLFGGDPRELSPEFQRVTVDLNRDAVLRLHNEAKELPPGIEVVTGTHLRIK
jgi:hypothetical protein